MVETFTVATAQALLKRTTGRKFSNAAFTRWISKGALRATRGPGMRAHWIISRSDLASFIKTYFEKAI